ncbi:MAG TPA: lipopolysaccharide assembly protein LapA domain-containing protein [Bradyrhizobium sp.]|nr:lipopolysaccharide assembly protein LapA domain-containing protein [Bradyrhizobium sp.]
MRKFFSALVLIPLGLVLTVFAVANRHLVTVSFDPFHSSDPTVAVKMPLFVVIVVVAIIGVAAGGSATWFRQRHWRRSARRHEADARAARSQLADLRAGTAAPRGDLQRLPALTQAGGYRSGGRDKQGATL